MWQDGRRAWEWLTGWHQSDPTPHRVIGPVRPTPCGPCRTRAWCGAWWIKAEVNAVVAAPVAGATWAEIAGMLGVAVEAVQQRWPEE